MRLSPIAVVLAFSFLLIGCQDTSPRGDAVDGDVSMPVDSAPPDPEDAAVPNDATVPPVGVPHDFCGQNIFVLPIGGPSENVQGLSLWDGKLAYSRGPRNVQAWDVYCLDLRTCLEYKLTSSEQAGFPHIRGSDIVWLDNRGYDPTPGADFHALDIYAYDLETWTETQLTNHPLGEWDVKTNGRYVVYSRSIAEAGNSAREILLLDRQQGSTQQLHPPGSGVGYIDITERYVAWSDYPQLASSLGKDVFYYDLVTGLQEHVARSADYYCYQVRLWGDYLTYTCSEYWGMTPYHLFLHHIPTGEELHLDGAEQNTAGITDGVVHANLVVWNTSKHMGQVEAFELNFDIEAYDIPSGQYRRITTAPSRWRVLDVYSPYMTLIRSLGDYVYEFAVANLRELGIIDEDDNLLPGAGVLVPPE